MKIVLIIFLCIILLVIVLSFFLQKSHIKWLASQSPIGTWISKMDNSVVLLEFQGGHAEGTYKQITEKDGQKIKEFGHWFVSLNNLQMIIMATDIKDHPRFGVDTNYLINYPGPTSIRIDGPERQNLVFEKTTEKIKF